MGNYWKDKGIGYWLSRAAAPLLFIIGMVIYRSCDSSSSNSYKLDQNEINRLSAEIDHGKISVRRNGDITNIEWDSLSNEELNNVFQVETIRRMFKEINAKDSIDVESQFLSRFSGGRFKRLINAYQRNSIEARNLLVRQYNDSINTPFDKSIQQEFLRVWKKLITTPKDLNRYLASDPSFGNSIEAEKSNILRPLIVTAVLTQEGNYYKASFITYKKMLLSKDSIEINEFRVRMLLRVSKEVIEDVERKVVGRKNITYLSFLD
jgi:hypothetical protein